jgi:plastocyanin
MHSLAVQLAPILAAEKSKVPFYIAGGLLVAWALIVSLALGLRRPEFPGGQAGERAVIGISVVLVLAAVASAVLTSGAPTTAKAAVNLLSAPAPNPSLPGAGGSAAAASSTPSQPATASVQAPATPSAQPPATAGAGTALKLAANPTGLLSFDSKQLSAKAGAVTITFANGSPIEHNVTVSQGATVLAATPTFTGGSKTLTIKLKPGTYTFYCSVPGHRQAGMEGTLKIS